MNLDCYDLISARVEEEEEGQCCTDIEYGKCAFLLSVMGTHHPLQSRMSAVDCQAVLRGIWHLDLGVRDYAHHLIGARSLTLPLAYGPQ